MYIYMYTYIYIYIPIRGQLLQTQKERLQSDLQNEALNPLSCRASSWKPTSSYSDSSPSDPECDGKTRRQCFNAPGCKFNRNNQVCAPNVGEPQTQPKALPVPPNQASPESFPKTSVAEDEGCHQKWHITTDFTK